MSHDPRLNRANKLVEPAIRGRKRASDRTAVVEAISVWRRGRRHHGGGRPSQPSFRLKGIKKCCA